MKVENYIKQLASFIQFFVSALERGISLKVIFCELKMAASRWSVCYIWICHSDISLPSSILSAEDILYLEKKRPQPKGRKITVSDNTISQAFYFKTWWNEIREILTGRNFWLTVQFCLRTIIESLFQALLVIFCLCWLFYMAKINVIL